VSLTLVLELVGVLDEEAIVKWAVLELALV